jgi:hypothetical protein
VIRKHQIGVLIAQYLTALDVHIVMEVKKTL